MKIINVMIAFMLACMSLLIFIATIVTPSPIKAVGVFITGLMFLVSILGIKMLYKEYREGKHD